MAGPFASQIQAAIASLGGGGGGGGTPGGSSGSIQYNNAGAFGGLWSADANKLDFGGNVSIQTGPSSVLDDAGILMAPSTAPPGAFGVSIGAGQASDGSDLRLKLATDSAAAIIQLAAAGEIALTATTLKINNTEGVTAGPFTVITSIATKNGLVTTLTGS